MSATRTSAVTAVGIVVAVTAVTGCAEKTAAKGSDVVQVTATDSRCQVSKTTFPAGHVKIAVQNKGSKITEVYVYTPSDKIVTERENIGPGTKATITAEIKAGSYEVACKPGMKGDGIRQKITVTGKGAAKTDPRLDTAVAEYRQYAQAQADLTIPAVKKFADAIKKGDIAGAKTEFANSRIGWERAEPVAESFGDIDPKTDTRADGVEAGQKWTGWHRLEKALWQDKKIGPDEKKLAAQLVTDLEDWQARVGKAEITATSMANGAKELLDEVATGKVTGEEDRYSHTDLSDFYANVEGAEKAYQLLKPVASENEPALTKELDKQFTSIKKLLDTYREGDGFVSYDTVGKTDRKGLADAVNSLAEPLSTLAAAVAK
ncbi:iron uptake system protein EfeO [Actinacidiphila soli]|uniref:iron uptake system protein EfeO n=1 Tax=Actinacidiphila soli TaxID=2487275 RepID=UPI000FCB2E6B|nr:iron uptake system protein EfeO [Actinacidiphila soli]